MPRRLGDHRGRCEPLDADQALIGRHVRQAADKTRKLAGVVVGLVLRLGDAVADGDHRNVEPLLHLLHPFFRAGIACRDADQDGHVPQAVDAVHHGEGIDLGAVVVHRIDGADVLRRPLHDDLAPLLEAEIDVVLAVLLSELLRHLLDRVVDDDRARAPLGEVDHLQPPAEAVGEDRDGCGLQLRLAPGIPVIRHGDLGPRRELLDEVVEVLHRFGGRQREPPGSEQRQDDGQSDEDEDCAPVHVLQTPDPFPNLLLVHGRMTLCFPLHVAVAAAPPLCSPMLSRALYCPPR